MISMIILVRFVYYTRYKEKESFFTFYLLNFIVFLLAFMLGKAGGLTSLGGAFGLLAAFSLLRFRTETISITEMTYLFIVMTFGLMNSLMNVNYIEITTLNAMIIIVVYIVDGNLFTRHLKFKTIDYPSVEHIKPVQHIQLIAELRELTGLDIQKISIEHIDVSKKKVLIKMYYY